MGSRFPHSFTTGTLTTSHNKALVLHDHLFQVCICFIPFASIHPSESIHAHLSFHLQVIDAYLIYLMHVYPPSSHVPWAIADANFSLKLNSPHSSFSDLYGLCVISDPPELCLVSDTVVVTSVCLRLPLTNHGQPDSQVSLAIRPMLPLRASDPSQGVSDGVDRRICRSSRRLRCGVRSLSVDLCSQGVVGI